MSKLLHLWRALGDASVARLRHETINLHGVRKLVSDDDDFLLGLACAELLDALWAASHSVAARCADPGLRAFSDAFSEFADTGRDRHRWAAPSCKEMDARAHRMEKQVASTAALRSLTLSSAVHPSGDAPRSRKSMSMSMEELPLDYHDDSLLSSSRAAACDSERRGGFSFRPPPGTLGAAALAPRYAAVVMSIERMARWPRLVGPEERDELYGMLTASVRAQLRARRGGGG